jgi:hypothetical protein
MSTSAAFVNNLALPEKNNLSGGLTSGRPAEVPRQAARLLVAHDGAGLVRPDPCSPIASSADCGTRASSLVDEALLA